MSISKWKVQRKICIAACVLVLASSQLQAQCTRTITDDTLFSITVGSTETVCIANDLYVAANVNIALGGRLIVAPNVRMAAYNVNCTGTLELDFNSFLYIDNMANFNGAGASLVTGVSSRMFNCRYAFFNNGATLTMNQNSIFDAFHMSFAGSTDYASYVGSTAADPRAYIISRNQTLMAGQLSSDSMIGYCGVWPLSMLTPAQLDEARAYCTPLIPPAIYTTNLCSAVREYYMINSILNAVIENIVVENTGSGSIYSISWEIFDDNSIQRFEIQRAFKESTFETIQNVTPFLYAGQKRSYVCFDTVITTNAREILYRVKAVRRDGSSFYSVIRRIAVRTAPQSLLIHPNPVGREATVLLPADAQRAHKVLVEIMSRNGNIVYRRYRVLSGSALHLTADVLNHLPAGLYGMKVSVKDRMYASQFLKL